MDPSWTEKQKKLAQLVDRIFEDGVVDASEAAELRQYWANSGMTVPEVKAVIDAFVARVWGEVIEDGVISVEERERLRNLVSGLNLPKSMLPQPVVDAIGG